jgi:hypothetical protein
MIAFWNIAPRSLIEVNQCFRGVYCLHYFPNDKDSATPLKHWSSSMRLHGIISLKAIIFILAFVRTRNLSYNHIIRYVGHCSLSCVHLIYKTNTDLVLLLYSDDWYPLHTSFFRWGLCWYQSWEHNDSYICMLTTRPWPPYWTNG